MKPEDFIAKLGDLFTDADARERKRHHEHEARMTELLQELIERPFSRWLRADATSVSGTNVVLNFGAPPAGMEWRVRNITVTGTDPFTTVASAQAAVFRNINLTPFELIDAGGTTPGASVPNTAFYGIGQLTLRAPNLLVVGVGGAITNATRLFAAALVEQVPVGTLPDESATEIIETPAVTRRLQEVGV